MKFACPQCGHTANLYENTPAPFCPKCLSGMKPAVDKVYECPKCRQKRIELFIDPVCPPICACGRHMKERGESDNQRGKASKAKRVTKASA